MSLPSSRNAFEQELNRQRTGLQFHVAALGEAFESFPQSASILVAPTLGADASLTGWFKDMIMPFAGERLYTQARLQMALQRFAAPAAFHQIVLSAVQAAFANRLNESEQISDRREPLLPVPFGHRAPMSHLEVMGTINAMRSDRVGLVKLVDANTSRSGRAFRQIHAAQRPILKMAQRLSQFCLEDTGVRYILLSNIDQPQVLGDVARYPHRITMTLGLLNAGSMEFEFFATSRTREACSHAPPYILMGTMLRQILESRSQGMH